MRVRTDSGTQVSGYAIRLGEDSGLVCSNSTLNGSFRAIGDGTVGITGPGTGVPIAVVNNLNLDGSGNVHAFATTRSANGVISSGGTATVAYTVNADCTSTNTLTPSSGPVNHANIVVDRNGAGRFFIRPDSGNTTSGYAIRF